MLTINKTGWVGFDIGAASVKVAQIVRADGGYRIASAAIVERRERWSPQLLGDEAPRSSADELMAAASLCDRLSGSAAAAMLPAAICEMVQMDAPTSKRASAPTDLVRAIQAETQRTIQDRVFDTWPAGGQAGKINAVTAPRAWSDQISQDVSKAGWNCRVVDALPWALARAASIVEPAGSARNIAVLDWGYGKATMALLHKGAPAHVRSLRDCAFQDVLSCVSAGLRVDEHDAEVLLQKFGLSHGEQPGGSARIISDLIAEPLSRLTQEIRRTLGYWQGVTRGHGPEVIYMFGGGGALVGVDERLSTQLGMPVSPWRLPQETAVASDVPPHCLLGAAVGLSLLAWEVA